MGTGYSIAAYIQWKIEGGNSYGHAGYVSAKKEWKDPDLVTHVLPKEGTNIVITGANAGLGYSATKRFAELGYTVHMLCRNPERGEKARKIILDDLKIPEEKLIVHTVDLSSRQSVRDWVTNSATSISHINAYIHNAGVMLESPTTTDEGSEVTVSTMLCGSHLLVSLIQDKIASVKGRIINVSSGGQYLARLETTDLEGKNEGKYDGTFRYARVKRMQVALTEKWAKVLAPANIGVYSMHPGWADSPGFQSSMPEFYDENKKTVRSSEEGADTMVWLAISTEVGMDQSGKFFLDRNVVRKWMPLSCTKYSDEDVEQLWKSATTYCQCEKEISELQLKYKS